MSKPKSRKMISITDLVRSFAADDRAKFAAGLARAEAETPEEAQAAQDRDQLEARQERLALQAFNRRARYEDARPLEYADASLDRLLDQQNPEGKGRRWLTSKAKIGLFFGPSGHGKTNLAYAITNAAITGGQWVEAWSVTELVQALAPLPKHARDDETRTRRQEQILDWAKECDLLLLDDLGAEEAGGYVAERWRAQLLDILNARDGEPRCRTIVTANGVDTVGLSAEAQRAVKVATANGIGERYSSRVANRLQHDFLGVWVEGESLRKGIAWNPFD